MINTHQECITMPKLYKQTVPKSSPKDFPTFPKMWNRVIMDMFLNIPRRVLFRLLMSDRMGNYLPKK